MLTYPTLFHSLLLICSFPISQSLAHIAHARTDSTQAAIHNADTSQVQGLQTKTCLFLDWKLERLHMRGGTALAALAKTEIMRAKRGIYVGYTWDYKLPLLGSRWCGSWLRSGGLSCFWGSLSLTGRVTADPQFNYIICLTMSKGHHRMRKASKYDFSAVSFHSTQRCTQYVGALWWNDFMSRRVMSRRDSYT